MEERGGVLVTGLNAAFYSFLGQWNQFNSVHVYVRSDIRALHMGVTIDRHFLRRIEVSVDSGPEPLPKRGGWGRRGVVYSSSSEGQSSYNALDRQCVHTIVPDSSKSASCGSPQQHFLYIFVNAYLYSLDLECVWSTVIQLNTHKVVFLNIDQLFNTKTDLAWAKKHLLSIFH